MSTRNLVCADVCAPDTIQSESGGIPDAIFGDSVEQARTVAVEVAQNAFWNSGYFGATYEDIRRARLW